MPHPPSSSAAFTPSAPVRPSLVPVPRTTLPARARAVGVRLRAPPRRPRVALRCASASGPPPPAEDDDAAAAAPASDAAKQVDDGSLSSSGSFVAPARLSRKKTKRKPSAPAEVLSTLVPSRRAPLAFLVRRLDSHKALMDGLLLAGLFLTWYWANTAFNVYNKQVLKIFPFPMTCTTLQFFVAAVCMALLWVVKVKKAPKVNALLVRSTLPLAVLHAAGFLLTNMSLGKVSVAFTHTVKSTEPFFSVALTPSILGEVPTWGILMSLCPIVAGVALASATDVSFNWIGFLSAVGSNLALQSRNVLSKKLMTTAAASSAAVPVTTVGGTAATVAYYDTPPSGASGGSGISSISEQSVLPFPTPGSSSEDDAGSSGGAGAPGGGGSGSSGASATPSGGRASSSRGGAMDEAALREETFARLDNVNLFSTMTILAFFLLCPLAILWEGIPLLTAAAQPAVTGMSVVMLYRKLILGGVCRCLDVLASYMILQRVSPVTHSVGNCVKRAVVIAMSIVIFKTQMSFLNVIGTCLALAGVFVYSMVVSACKQNSFGPESPLCKPIYEMEVELTEGGGI